MCKKREEKRKTKKIVEENMSEKRRGTERKMKGSRRQRKDGE